MNQPKKGKYAIWVITPNGVKLAKRIVKDLSGADVYLSDRIIDAKLPANTFQTISEALANNFEKYSGHIFIMSTGIVVRVIAPFIRHKTEDPAVVVVDDQGRHAISLLAGHLGGANMLTHKVAKLLGANPVITTATDVSRKPAIDIVAKAKKLHIENPQAIKAVNMALLTDQKIYLHDPYVLLQNDIPNTAPWPEDGFQAGGTAKTDMQFGDAFAGVFVDDIRAALPSEVLILRPATLVVGIGCNRHTPMEEIKSLLDDVFKKNRLANASLNRVATIDLKADEPGLVELAKYLKVPITFFSREEIKTVAEIQNPSAMVEKHIGVKSVCEAAAILASAMGTLIVPKQTTANVTVAIARNVFTS
jgi:cobalt-precorrin 5A hydrolase